MIKFNQVTWYSQLTAIILGVMIFFAGIYVGEYGESKKHQTSDTDPINSIHNSQAENSSADTSWVFEEASTNNLDGKPQTNIFLTVKKGDREIEQLIDTVDGDCSLGRENMNEDIEVRCYYAGLGQWYRVNHVADDTYLVERKLHEEALPDVDVKNYEWEIITKYTLF